MKINLGDMIILKYHVLGAINHSRALHATQRCYRVCHRTLAKSLLPPSSTFNMEYGRRGESSLLKLVR